MNDTINILIEETTETVEVTVEENCEDINLVVSEITEEINIVIEDVGVKGDSGLGAAEALDIVNRIVELESHKHPIFANLNQLP